MAFRLALLAAAGVACASAVKVGDTIPAATLDFGFPPEKIDLQARLSQKNTILISLPGAFTPTWSTVQIPGYLKAVDALKAIGIDEVIVFCVNDGAVMDAWASDQGVEQGPEGLLTFMGDPSSDLVRKLDLLLTHDGPQGKGLFNRGKRAAMYVEDGVVKVFRLAENNNPDQGLADPAGDDFPDATLAEAMIEAIEAYRAGKDEL